MAKDSSTPARRTRGEDRTNSSDPGPERPEEEVADCGAGSSKHGSESLPSRPTPCEDAKHNPEHGKLDSAFSMNLKHTDNCKLLESSNPDQGSLCMDDLRLLNHEMFDSIANAQLQRIISGPVQTNQTSTESRTLGSRENGVAGREGAWESAECRKKGGEREPGEGGRELEHAPRERESGTRELVKEAGKEMTREIGSFLNLRIYLEENEVWKQIIKRVEPFLDVYSLLMLRQTCKVLYYHKYKLRSHNTLSFRGFAGFDSKWIFDTILPLIHHVLDLPDNCRLRFDFTGCILLKDIATVYLLKSGWLSSSCETRQYARNVRELVFDFCHQITDKSLEVMLTTKLPNLQRLSVTCCRNENFTGLPFVRDLSTHNWPKFCKFRCTFSNIFLEPLQTIADFITRSAGLAGAEAGCEEGALYSFSSDATGVVSSFPSNMTSIENMASIDLIPPVRRDSNLSSARETSSLQSLTPGREGAAFGGGPGPGPGACGAEPGPGANAREDEVEFEICGSWGSRRLLDKLGFGIYCTTFTNALKSNNYNMCSKLTKKLQIQLLNVADQPSMRRNSCLALVRNRGSELLVNCPITVKDRSHNNVGIWTLPILLVIQQQNMDMFMLLIKRGARLNVWDSMNKSPLLIACELSLASFAERILKFNLAPVPYDVPRNIPLIVSISNANLQLVKLLLRHNLELNYRCPSIRDYKAPLYVACERYSVEIIRLLLEHGADPNWKYRHRSTPTLLAYQQDPAVLELFLDYGAGATSDRRWVLVQVLSCAIVKDDQRTAEMLARRYPDLAEREHEIWSKPIIAVSKLNRLAMLRMLLGRGFSVDTFDSFGTTAAHAACEEGNADVLRLLLEHGVNLDAQDVFGRTPLHLAVLENKLQVIGLLLERGASIELKEYSFGETPLMTAVRTRNEQVASLILRSRKVDAVIVDYNGRNISYYLQFYKMPKLEAHLSSAG